MNAGPPREFDPDEELGRLNDPEQEHYGLSDRTFFYTIITCRAIESFAEPSFVIDAVLDPKTEAPAGCAVDFIVRSHAFRLDVGPQRVRLFASVADEPDNDNDNVRRCVFDGDAANPASWENLLIEIGHVEEFGVIGAHADRLRLMWTQWLAERNRRADERGF